MFPILFLLQYSSCRQLQKHWIDISDQGQGPYRSRVEKCTSSKRRCVRNKLLSRTQLRVLQLRWSEKWNSSMWIEQSKSPTSLQRRFCVESRIYLPLYCGKNVILPAVPISREKRKQSAWKAKACGFSFSKLVAIFVLYKELILPSKTWETVIGQLAIRHRNTKRCLKTPKNMAITWMLWLPLIHSPGPA